MKKKKKRLGETYLQEIIEMCKRVEERDLNPFDIDIEGILAVVQKYFPDWESPEEFCLDAEAIHRVASVIQLQSDWVKHRSTSLYTDPFLLEEKIRKMSKDEMVKTFLETWHPVVELEQITTQTLIHAFKYWRNLLSFSERWSTASYPTIETRTTTPEEAIRQKILADKSFSEELEVLWIELKRRAGKNGRIRYWDFVQLETYQKTVKRVYMTSFLITYGYATLEIYPLEEEIFIKPFEKPIFLLGEKQTISIPISMNHEKWRTWKEGRRD